MRIHRWVLAGTHSGQGSCSHTLEDAVTARAHTRTHCAHRVFEMTGSRSRISSCKRFLWYADQAGRQDAKGAEARV